MSVAARCREAAVSAPPNSSPDHLAALRLRTALPALILLLISTVLSVLGLRQGDLAAPHADVTTLPTTIGRWHMVANEVTDPADLRLTPAELGALSLDSWTQRAYEDNSGRRIYLLLEYRRLGRGAFNHRPEACYPAVGYVLSHRRTVGISYGGAAGSAIAMTANYSGSLGNSHQVLLYWFASGSRCVSSFWAQQVEMALGRLRPQSNGWAFVRLVSETKPGTESKALFAEQQFAREASPAIIRAISPGK